jgi:predicted transcriptional regulator
MKNITTEQIKAARILLGWDQVELAKRAGVGVATLRRIEAVPGLIDDNSTSAEKIITALLNADIEFLNSSKGLGVRLVC